MILPILDIMDIGTIILVIGLVEMLKFLYKNGDLGGLNKKVPIFSPASACLGVRRGCYCVRAVCYCVQPTTGIEITTLISREISRNGKS